MGVMSFRDSMFLLAESRERPTHVGSLLLFERPEGAGPDFLGDLHKQLVSTNQVASPFARRAVRSVGTLGQWAWEDDPDLDIEYHVRLSALPRPGRIRELLELVSRLHGTLLDRHRPLWEFHLIEGIAGDRFAVYFKIHHALMDGVTGMRHLQKALSTDPEARDMPPFWQVDPRSRRKPAAVAEAPAADEKSSLLSSAGSALAGGWNTVSAAVTDTVRTASQALGIAPAMLDALYDGLAHRDTALPFEAPHSMFNVPITGARRFAAESWPIKRIQRVRERTASTVNDVVLAMCAGALRRYMVDHDELPDRPLVAALPVSLGTSGDGNQLGAILVDPRDRRARRRHAAGAHQGLRQGGEGEPRRARPDGDRGPVDGRRRAARRWVRCPGSPGAQPGLQPDHLERAGPEGRRCTGRAPSCDGMYPLSVPMDGQALNITVISYADNIEFGLTGAGAACRACSDC